MSEYQYYEFMALDRPLSDDEYEHVRALSTRAEISRTRFVNEYEWGDFRGEAPALMDLCYDAHLYFANWGTHILMLRLPLSSLDLDTATEYCNDESFSARRSGKNIVLEFQSEDESGEDWGYEHPALSSLVGLRAELAAGDLRPLYLAWLAGAQYFEGDEEDLSTDAVYAPPVPAGLGRLTGPQHVLARYLRVDQDLLGAAALASNTIPDGPTIDPGAAVNAWIKGLTPKQKDEALRRLLSDDDLQARAELLRATRPRPAGIPAAPQSIGSLMAAASDLAGARESARRKKLEEE